MGPLLFIWYINDLADVISHSKTLIYADDTALLDKGHDVTTIEHELSSDFNVLSKWFEANKLSVNSSKSNVMLFCGPRSKHRGSTLHISCSDHILSQIDTVQFLGVELDEHLTFSTHIGKRCRKVK